MAQTQLAIAIVLPDSVYKALGRDEESKVVATTDSADHNLVMEGHLYRNTVFLT